MTKKNLIYCAIAAAGLLFACAGWHYVYEIFPAAFMAFVAPVNESIWEHSKLFFVPVIVFLGIRYVILKNKTNNPFITAGASSAAMIGMMIAVSLPYIYFNGKSNEIFFIILTYLTLFIGLVISVKIEQLPKIRYGYIKGVSILALIFIAFCLFTVYPPHEYLFYDITTGTYGIPDLNLL